MALNDHTVSYAGTGPTLAAPTTTQTVANIDDDCALLVVIGGTATTITIVVPGNDAVGVARADQSIGPLTNTTRVIKIDKNYRDSDGLVTVNFSQVTGVTASIIRV